MGLHHFFEQATLDFPHKKAIIFKGGFITYNDLDNHATALAKAIVEKYSKSNIIGISATKSIEMIVGVLAILKAGKAYMPIDANYPLGRLENMIDIAELEFVISSKNEEETWHGLGLTRIDFNEKAQGNVDLKTLGYDLATILFTSGSTGTPKGVMLKHEGLCDFIKYQTRNTRIKGLIKKILYSHLSFDSSIDEIFTPLALGGEVHIIDDLQKLDSLELLKYIKEYGINRVYFPYISLQYFCETAITNTIFPESLVEVITGGELLKITPSIRKFFSHFPGSILKNSYGPTEATIQVLEYDLEGDSKEWEELPPLGKPIANCGVWILNQDLQMAEANEIGEVYISGPCLASGYIKRPDLTADSFCHWITPEGENIRLYKTGDLAFKTEKGFFYFKGREDHQVKIRGNRVELGEIEMALGKIFNVKMGVVKVEEDHSGQKILNAYVQFFDSPTGDLKRIINILKKSLPDYMVPDFIIEVKDFPKTKSGKVDRNALLKSSTIKGGVQPSVFPKGAERRNKDMDFAHVANQEEISISEDFLNLEGIQSNDFPEMYPNFLQGEYLKAPLTTQERQLVDIWQRLLGVKKVGIHDDFFALGGHSLHAMRVVSMVQREMEHILSIRDLFSYPTIAQLSSKLQPQSIALVKPVLQAGLRPDHLPLSYNQESLWFIDQLVGSVQYHIPMTLRIRGKLDEGSLASALQTIVNRHEILRTVITDIGGQDYQMVQEQNLWHLEVLDGNQEGYVDFGSLQKKITSLVQIPFDLRKDHMVRASLIRLAPEDHALVLIMHHIASDGWSSFILRNELIKIYEAYSQGGPMPLAPLPLQYIDYALWQRAYLDGEVLEEKLSFWKRKLQDLSPIQLPTDFPRPTVQSIHGDSFSFTLEPDLVASIQALGNSHNATLFMTLLSAFKVLLYRYSGQEDICVGTPTAGREMQEVEELIGFFVNTLVLRTTLQGSMSFIELLKGIRSTTLEAYENQQVPFEKVVEVLGQERDMGRNPIFQVLFALQNVPENQISFTEASILEEKYSNKTAKFDLTFELTEIEGRIEGEVEYCTDLYKEETIRCMVSHYMQLLESIVVNPELQIGRLQLLRADEEQLLLHTFNDTQVSLPKGKTIVDLFEEQVNKTPDAVAVVFEGNQLTYRDLDGKSNQLAHYLRNEGVKEECLVPICMERSLEMVIGILGILKAGAVYVPIDPAYPEERISYMLEDTKATIIVCNRETVLKLNRTEGLLILDTEKEAINTKPTEKLFVSISPSQLAYVIYTSGSTGQPKGVMIEHHSVVNFLLSMSKEVEFSSTSSLLSVTTYSFDIFYLELYLPLINGGKVILVSRETAMDGFILSQKLSVFRPTHMQATPSNWQILLNSGWENQEKVNLLVGGEALSEDIKTSLSKIGKVWNLYGPTETTIWSAVKKIISEEKVLIGRPIDNTSIYILSKDNQPNPIGVVGELCIAGEGVGRGYLNLPELTDKKFKANPFSKEKGARMYCTGDLARWLPDGNLECLGRIDDQVKIRGYRIELGEIEAVLQQQGQVRQAVVLAQADQQGGRRLVGYVVVEGSFDREAVVGFLKTKLPEHMIPAIWVELESLPLTFNGKINKKALPEGDTDNLGGRNYEAPRNSREKQLAGIWQRLLGMEKVGIHDDFFALGGHSLLATRVAASVRMEMALELPIRELFSFATIAQLAGRLGKHSNALPQLNLQPGDRLDPIPLSYNQESLWFIHQLEGSVQYHIPMVLLIQGRLDEKALAAALQTIVDRHEVLRTVILEVDGQGYQKVLEKGLWQMEVTEAPNTGESFKGGALQDEISRLTTIPFNLSSDHMLRANLVKLGLEENVLVLTMHHIGSDGWSSSLLRNELVTIYEAFKQGRPNPLAPLSVQYIDYALWQRAYLHGEVLEGKLSYWKAKLKDLTPLQLPTDFPRPQAWSTHGALFSFTIEPDLVASMQDLGSRHNATLFMTLLAAFKVLLYRYSGQEDLCVGTPTAGREMHEVEELIGFFVNTLVLRTNLQGSMSFIELLNDIRSTTLEAYENQQVPFEKVVEALGHERDLSRNPVFQVLFALQNVPKSILQLTDATLSEETYEHPTAKFDFTFELTETAGGVEGAVEYCTDLYKEDTIRRMVSNYKQLLKSIGANPTGKIGQLKLLTADEEKLLLHTFNDTKVVLSKGKTFLDQFEEQVLKTPDGLAVVFEKKQMTYRELDLKSNQLAHYLKSKGVKKESLVPICLDRSLEMIIGIIGILKAGGAYVPIDPSYPGERINYVLKDTNADIVLTNSEGKTSLTESERQSIIDLETDWITISQESIEHPVTRPAPHHLAYVIYTSGSTGKPKGVLIEHGGLCNSTQARQFYYQNQESVLLIPSFAFDSSVAVIFGSLSTGGQLLLCRSALIKDPSHLKRLLKDTNIILCVPSYYKFLLEEELTAGSALSKVIVAGENLDVSLVRLHFDKTDYIPLYNEYGPTECTVWATVAEIPSSNAKVTIGRPIYNTSVYIVSKNSMLNPMGVAGELCIGGEGVSRGYLNLPELTEEKFVPNPFSEDKKTRMYRTGDLARWLPDGNIEYLGRLDDQVKIRGYRIELGEIEAVLNGIPEIKEAAAAVWEDDTGNKRLVGYVVGSASFLSMHEQKRTSSLREELRNLLPEYMVPGDWVFLKKLPLTANNKIDRKRLPAPNKRVVSSGTAPVTRGEKLVASIWSEILGIPGINREDSFFNLGGHSLLAIRAIVRIERETGLKVPISVLFSHPILADFVEFINLDSTNEDKFEGVYAKNYEPIPVQLESDDYEVSSAQRRLWILEKFGTAEMAYHMPNAYRLEGELNGELIKETVKKLLERHSILRTGIRDIPEKGLRQVIFPDSDIERVFGFRDISSESEKEFLLEAILKQKSAEKFDLEGGPLIKVDLLRLSVDCYVLLIVMHHIISDAWSIRILMREFAAIYNSLKSGIPIDLSDLTIQYKDYAFWHNRSLEGPEMGRQREFWLDKLSGELPLVNLQGYGPRPKERTYNGSTVCVPINPSVLEKLRDLSSSIGGTLFMGLWASVHALLYRYTGQEDLVIGTPIAGRDHSNLENQIGFYLNMLAVRTKFSGEGSFKDLILDSKRILLEAYDHHSYPYDRLVEELRIPRDLGRNPLFDIVILLEEEDEGFVSLLDGVRSANVVDVGIEGSKFDLSFIFAEGKNSIDLLLEYNSDIYARSQIDLLAENFGVLLMAATKESEKPLFTLDFPSVKEGEQVLRFFNQTMMALSAENSFLEHFDRIVNVKPHRIAVSSGNSEINYSELRAMSVSVSSYINSLGIGRGDVVGVMLDRRPELIGALLGVLRSGAAYLPIDSAFPEGRISYMLEDSGAKLLITEKLFLGNYGEFTNEVSIDTAISHGRIALPTSGPLGGDLAYILYTSGSTGHPKGVEVSHLNLLNFLESMLCDPGLSADDRLLALTTISFDIAGLELFLPLIIGAEVVLADTDTSRDGRLLLDLLKKKEITVMQATPTTWRMLMVAGWNYPLKLKLLCGGEPLPADLARKIFSLVGSFWNVYGPTETTIWSTVKRIMDPEEITIGRPIANTQVYILDKYLNPVPLGSVGEICVGGLGVANGYRNRKELTSKNFLTDPFTEWEGSKLYRTGDLGRYLPDGEIICLGRVDSQVKIRGYRIELGEIEEAIKMQSGVKEAVVIAREDTPGEKKLVAYVVEDLFTDTLSPLRISHLKECLRASLPDYMVPSQWVPMEKFPLTANNKVNRRKLPQPLELQKTQFSLSSEPTTKSEKMLSIMWSKSLKRRVSDTQADFFELGGHSLLAVEIMTKIEKETGLNLPLNTLFKYPTLGAFAGFLDSHDKSKISWDCLVPIKPEGSRTPLYLIHGAGANVSTFYNLAQNMDKEQPVYGLQAKGLNGIDEPLRTIKEMAAHYIEVIRKQNPQGPYIIGGLSFGSYVAFEMAKQMKALNLNLQKVILFDAFAFQNERELTPFQKFKSSLGEEFQKKLIDVELLFKSPKTLWRLKTRSLQRKKRGILKSLGLRKEGSSINSFDTIEKIRKINHQAMDNYNLAPYDGDIILFKAKIKTYYHNDMEYYGWRPYVNFVHSIEMEGDHNSMFEDIELTKILAGKLQRVLEE